MSRNSSLIVVEVTKDRIKPECTVDKIGIRETEEGLSQTETVQQQDQAVFTWSSYYMYHQK